MACCLFFNQNSGVVWTPISYETALQKSLVGEGDDASDAEDSGENVLQINNSVYFYGAGSNLLGLIQALKERPLTRWSVRTGCEARVTLHSFARRGRVRRLERDGSHSSQSRPCHRNCGWVCGVGGHIHALGCERTKGAAERQDLDSPAVYRLLGKVRGLARRGAKFKRADAHHQGCLQYTTMSARG